MARVVNTPPPKPSQPPSTLTNGQRHPRRCKRQHIYSTIEDADADYDVDDGVHSDESDHGIYSEPEHVYSCIEDVRRSGGSGGGSGGRVVSVEIEKDSEEEGSEGRRRNLNNNNTKGRERKENGRKSNGQMPVLAKALYDNNAESPDELTFRRGDVLTVLERNFRGLQGWCLVQYKGRTGIAPDNRLKVLAGMYDGGGGGGGDKGGGGGGGDDGEKTSTPNWNRRSWAIEPDKVLTPRKVGDVYIYDQPDQDYDVPPSRYFPNANTSTIKKSPIRPNNNTPNLHQQPTDPSEIYDSPRSLALNSLQQRLIGGGSGGTCQPDYDTPQGSNRSSTVSMLSTGSAASNLSVPCSSASSRSSAELRTTQDDIYDVPPAAKPLHQQQQHGKFIDSLKLDMALESLETYDIPKNLKNNQSFDASMEIYDTPPKLKQSISYDDYDYAQIPEDNSSRISSDSGVETKMEHFQIAEDIYDTPPSRNSAPVLGPKKGSRCSLHALMPSPVPEDIYDVPPMVTRDPSSLLRQKSGRSSSNHGSIANSSFDSRMSMCSENSSSGSSDIPSISYKELKLDLQTALEQLNAALDDVSKSTKRLLGFVSSHWRKRENLETNLFDIKVSCIAVRTALHEFVEFSEGTVANSVKIQDKKLVKNLVKNLEPIQGYLKQVDQAMKGLEEQKWLLSKLTMNTPTCSQTDELGTIVNVARLLPEHAKVLHTIIQANALLLFEGQDGSVQSPKKAKPARPPPPTMPKPKRSPSEESDQHKSQRQSIQERPLPTPPRPLPKPPGETSSGSDTPSRTSLSRHSSIVSSSTSRSSRSRSVSPQPPITFRARSNSDYDNNWGNNVEYRDSTTGDVIPGDYVSLDEDATFGYNAPFNNSSILETDTMGYETPASTMNGSLSMGFKEKLKQVHNSINESSGQIYDSPSALRPVEVPELDENDRMVLNFYSEQTVSSARLLGDVIDGFFAVMRQEPPPPPQTFVEHSKAVIVSGQKLVFICDTITRNVVTPAAREVREKVMSCAFHLCECLKLTVTSTKNAGRHYPNLVAMQDMNDRLVDVSHAANEVKLVITQAAAL